MTRSVWTLSHSEAAADAVRSRFAEKRLNEIYTRGKGFRFRVVLCVSWAAGLFDAHLGSARFRRGFLSQQRQLFFHQRVRGNTMFLAQNGHTAVLDEFVRPTDAHDRGMNS